MEPTPNELPAAMAAAEQDLIESLEKACALEPEAPGEESTGELLRLEEALDHAARAAERALALRRQRREQERPGGQALADASPRVREFTTPNSETWRVWAVDPAKAERTRRVVEQLEDKYREGWLAFEKIDGDERRRLTSFPADWTKRGDAQLAELLERATKVAPRRPPGSSAESPEAGRE